MVVSLAMTESEFGEDIVKVEATSDVNNRGVILGQREPRALQKTIFNV